MLWCWEGYEAVHQLEHCLPTGTTELVFSLNGGAALVAGPASQFFTLATSAQIAVLGVHFKPGGAFPFFRCPAGDLKNQNINLADVWGAEASLVTERVLAAKTMAARFTVVENALLSAAEGRFARHRAVTFALHEFERVPFVDPLAAVAERAGLSSRRFIEVFQNEVGLTPKLYTRIKRFQAVLDVLPSDHGIDWAGVAAHCGYFDQAHFIHDFREFSGMNPTAYAERRGPNRNHVPVA